MERWSRLRRARKEIQTNHKDLEIKVNSIPHGFTITQPHLLFNIFSIGVMRSLIGTISKFNLNGFIRCNEKTKQPELIVF